MDLMTYGTWADTAVTFQMILQMMGKVKLARMPPQPEWTHSLLQLTSHGFATGLIPQRAGAFEIAVDVARGSVDAQDTSGRCAGFALRDDASVADYYADFQKMLAEIGQATPINPTPQEVAFTTPFDRQSAKVDFDRGAVQTYLQVCTLAHNALLRFSSAWRGKKLLPALFWGTFDLTTILFSGAEKPFPGTGVIEQTAFDEQFIEFGFWPGDQSVDEPALFVLAYPFIEGAMSDADVYPEAAFFSVEKAEYFLPLRDLFARPDPEGTIVRFCQSAFDAITRHESWGNLGWLAKPLLQEAATAGPQG